MEPRPPRPRQQYLPNDAGPGAGGYQRTGAGTEQGMYAPPPGYSAPPAYPPEIDLVPRRERHRQRIARNILVALLVVAAIGALGWNVRDRFFSSPPSQNMAQVAPTPAPNPPAVNPDSSPSATNEEPPTQAPLVNNLLATSTPTPENDSESREITSDANDEGAAATEPALPDPEPDEATAPIDLEALLPTEADLPVQGLAMTNSGERTLTAVSGTFGSAEANAEAEQVLSDLGWSANVFNDFAAEAGTLPPDATSVITVSIHQFSDQAAASEALMYFSNVVVAVQGFSEGQADPVGDEIRLLRGVSEDGTTNVAAYIVDGPLLYRIGGSSPAGDPTGHVLQLANSLINGG